MNKKIFVIVLIVCLTFGMAFAAKKADIKVGAQVGYGSATAKTSYSNSTYKYQQGGLYIAANAEYEIKENIAVKAGLGINTFSAAKGSVKIGSGDWHSYSATDLDNIPMQFLISVAPVYNYELNKEVTISGAAGLELMLGKESKATDAKTKMEFGFGIEAAASYALNKELSVGGGIKFGMLFGNKNDHSYNYSTVKAFAGATYAL